MEDRGILLKSALEFWRELCEGPDGDGDGVEMQGMSLHVLNVLSPGPLEQSQA